MYFQFQYSQSENPLHVLSIPIQPIRKPFTCTFNSNTANQKILYMYFQFQYSQSENPLNIVRHATGCKHQSSRRLLNKICQELFCKHQIRHREVLRNIYPNVIFLLSKLA